MINRFGLARLKAPSAGTQPTQGGMRCGTCGETITVCAYHGAHPKEQQAQAGGGDVTDLGYHEPGCTYPQDSCWCKVGREWTV